jgi:hypothetical protein
MNNKHVNAVVIGAGAGGGAVAKELAVAGLSVIILERGKWPIYDDLAFDELGSQRVQVLHASYGPDWERNPRVVKFSDGNKRIDRVADDGMAICDFNHHNEGIISGGGLLANEFFMMPYSFSRSHPWGARWRKEHKDIQRDKYRRIGRLTGLIQEIPMFDSRVTIDEEVKDFWGIPVASLSGRRNRKVSGDKSRRNNKRSGSDQHIEMVS